MYLGGGGGPAFIQGIAGKVVWFWNRQKGGGRVYRGREGLFGHPLLCSCLFCRIVNKGVREFMRRWGRDFIVSCGC